MTPAHAEWVPDKNVEMVIGAGVGGAVDTLARLVVQVIEKKGLVPTTISPVNKPGGGMTVTTNYINGHEGDGHYVALIGSSWMTTGISNNVDDLLHSITPVTLAFDTPMMFGVAADSPLKDAKDLAEAMKKDPGSIRFAISTTAGNGNHLGVLKFAETAGVDPKQARVIVNDSGALSVTQLLGGHIEVCVCSLGLITPQVEAGKARVLGLLTAKRLKGAPDVPTFKEQGYDAVISGFQAFILPKGTSADQVAFWEKVLKEVIESDEVQDFVTKRTWVAEYVGQKDSMAQLEEQMAFTKAKLEELGLIKK